MKKKVVIFMALLLVVVVIAGVLAGCDSIIVKSEERDAAQIVATVTYGGQTANITKAELSVSFNNYAYLYVTYYGLTYQETANYLLRSLAQNKLLVLFAKEQVALALGFDEHPADIAIYDLLSDSEVNLAIENVNDDMLSAVSEALEDLINEAEYYSSSSSATDDSTTATYEEYTGDDAVRVYFDSDGGSDVERQRIQTGTTAFEPEEPTLDGYTFMGWYTGKNGTGDKWDFSSTVDETMTLYARWVKYYEPRTERSDEEEEDDDYDADYNFVEGDGKSISPYFFNLDGTLNEEIRALIYSRELEPEALADYSDEDYETALDEYLDKAVNELLNSLADTHLDYDYYLNAEYESLLIVRLERMIGDGRIGDGATVTSEEVEARWAALVEQNKETFIDNDTYQSALESYLSTTYYHSTKNYGYVINILLQLPDEDIEKLTTLVADGVYSEAYITSLRDEMLADLMINVSNPDYDSTYECENHTCDSDSSCDPMTCPNHSCIDAALTALTDEGEEYDLDQIISFEVDEDGTCSIVYNVSVCPEMAYLPIQVPAFTCTDGGCEEEGHEYTGIVEQIYNSLKAVKEAVEPSEEVESQITHVQGIYWMQQVATAWLYIVGDDSGSVSSSSNNDGLGYLVTPDGEDSDYIDSFTEHARALIKKGSGSFVVDESKGAELNNFYVYGDNFIESWSSDADSAYAGIFILVASYVPYDIEGWGKYTVYYDDDLEEYVEVGLELKDNVIPLSYIITYAADLSDCVTIYDSIYEALLAGKKAALYEKMVNDFGVAEYQTGITYYESAYKSLWKDLD